MIRRTGFWAAVFVAAALTAGGAVPQPRPPAAKAVEATARVVFVPLDDRPRSLGDVERLAAVADVELVVPPAAILSRHFKTGDGDAIAQWLDRLDPAAVDAVAVSIDMLAYGGLIGSRTGRVLEADARRRLEALARLKARRGDLDVFAFASILRLAPNRDGSNPKWNAALARWAELSPTAARDAEAAAELAAVEASLPAGMLDRYRALRTRNHAVAAAALEQLGRGEIDFLVIGDDEASETGVHVAERQQLRELADRTGRGDRVVFKHGVVDVAPLLLARAMAGSRQPMTVAVRYSSPEVEQAHATDVETTVHTAGLRVAAARAAAAVELEVFRSGDRAPAETLAKRLTGTTSRRAAVADVGEIGSGSALGLVEVLRSQKALRTLAGFAAGPSPRAAIATALAHAIAFERGTVAASATPARRSRVAAAHLALLLRRLITDVLLGDVVTPQAIDEVVTPKKFDRLALGDRERLQLEEYMQSELEPLAQSLAADFGGTAWRLPGKAASGTAVVVKDLTGMKVELPWAQVDEPDVTFTLQVEPAASTPKPPGPRIVR